MDYQTIKEYSAFIGLLLFFGSFAVIVAWTYRPGARKEHEEYGQIPFKDDENGK